MSKNKYEIKENREKYCPRHKMTTYMHITYPVDIQPIYERYNKLAKSWYEKKCHRAED